MKKNCYLVCAMLILAFVSCNQSDEQSINLPPNDFNLEVSDISTSGAKIQWTLSSDPEKGELTYDLYLNGKLNTKNIATNSFTLSNLEEDYQYSCQVISTDIEGNANVAEGTFKTLDDLNPTFFQVTSSDISYREAKINWTNSSDPEGLSLYYKVYVGDNLIQDNINAPVNDKWEFKFTSLSDNQTYSGNVAAVDVFGQETLSPFKFKTLDNLAPKDFDVTADTVTSTQAVISWTESIDPESETVKYSVFINGDELSSNLEIRTYTFSNLIANSTYNVTIEAIDTFGNRTLSTVVFKTP